VDVNTVGSYTITYKSKDGAGNEATEVTRTVNVTEVALPADVTKPVIALNGASTINVTQGTVYTELGATATDDRDGTVTVTISGTVDINTVGSYTITYKAKDGAGNEASVSRIVNIVAPIEKTTIKGVVVDDPIIGATVKLLSLDNDELETTTTDANGSYTLEVDNSKITNGFILEATSGTMNGQDFNETLRAIYGAGEDVEKANITLLTTLVAKMASEDSEISRSGTLLDKRDDALQKLSDMGMIKQDDWFKVEPSFVNMDELRSVVQYDGLDVWLNAMIVDLTDSELGSDKMRVFSNAHGGMSKVNISPDEFVSIFPGQEKIISVDGEFVDTNETNISIRKISGPDWITIQGNALRITPQSDLETYDDFTVQLEILANDVQIGRTKKVIVSLVKNVVLLSGELGAEGGKIENQWKDISLSVDANKLTQTYQIEYNAGLTQDDRLTFWVKTIPDMNSTEMSELNLIQPSYEIIKKNYLENNQTTIQSRSLRSGDTYEYSIWNSEGVASECRSGVVNGKINEMVWTDENDDGVTLPYVWRGWSDRFDSSNDASGSINGGDPRIKPGKMAKNPAMLCASALRSKIHKDTDIEGKEAVIFVNGFIRSGNLGGYDHNDGKPGGEYFGKFPKIVEDTGYLPFVFQWRTNAKFQTVADELYLSIVEIAKKTGKKVHIVAHSFGGLLSRTLIQGLSSESSEDASKYIASLTTVGTPHSGIFGSKTTINGITFPEGRHGIEGGAIENCRAITCYQAGEDVSLNKTLLGLEPNYGQTIYNLWNSIDSYPDIPTQVLIGLVLDGMTITRNSESENGATYNYNVKYDFFDNQALLNPGAGDYLISIFGQRIVPDNNQDNLNDMYLANNIEEHILPMDGRTSVFERGVDDHIVNQYTLIGNNDWTVNNYREDVSFSDLSKLAKTGYYHRTGSFKQYSVMVGSPGVGFEDYARITNSFDQTEVGLHECTSSSNCNHSTWNYFKTFVEDHPATAITPPEKITASGRVIYAGYSFIGPIQQTNNRNLNRETSVVPFSVTIEANIQRGGFLGSIIQFVSTGERTTLKDDGTYELNVTFSPDTNYSVIAYPTGDTLARIGAKVRAVKSKVLQTLGTVEESILHFPTITLTDDNYQEGNLSIKVTDGTSGTVLNGFDAEILNSTGINVDEANSLGIDTGYSATLAKGDYTVNISKDGYNDGQAQCTVTANETTECIVNIVSNAQIANGEITAVLSWGATPSDLDSHLVRKTNGSQDYHVYYSNRNGTDANLDRDDTDGIGPETITINNVNNDSVYTYYVYNYSGGAGSVLPNSGAKLELNFNGTQRTFTVPNEEGLYWKVFEIDNGRIIPCSTGCVQGDVSGIVRSLDRDAYLFRDLPTK
jgi:hypothetical protein